MDDHLQNIWVKLKDYNKPFFHKGLIVRFRTLDTAGNGWKYAVATQIDNYRNLGFVGLDGGTWGYGRCMLPDEASYQNNRNTISRDWLIENFVHIAEPEDHDDIWVCPNALDVLRAYELLSGTTA